METLIESCRAKQVETGKPCAISGIDIQHAEERLGQSLPASYKRWLASCETAKLYGNYILTVAPREYCEGADIDIATAHQTNLENGLTCEEHIALFEPDWNEWFYFDCSLQDANGEWPVFVKDLENGTCSKFADHFTDFMHKLLGRIASST
ncbi:SMI1/KNR4 family protein [Chitinilyticum litopenaei]|uniref:SMI1/KNR4 family protein n=2 Tax=Chitinilyticum piscinae TaxID=2866724 RepID=A0A8J7K205_9NEIS|nr:SMI1/KNR4 family protein [Chitinilyticum piscinae]